MIKEKQQFIKIISQAQIAASGKTQLDMGTTIRDYGNNYNTISILNTSAVSAIKVYFDGQAVKYIAQGGLWSFDWEFGLDFTLVEIENLDTVNVIPADTVKISIGRTGI